MVVRSTSERDGGGPWRAARARGSIMSTAIVKYRGALLAGTALGLFCLAPAHAQTVTNPTIATCVEDIGNAQFACGSGSTATPGTNATAVGNNASATGNN